MAPNPYMNLRIAVCVVQNDVDSSHKPCFLLVCPAWFAQILLRVDTPDAESSKRFCYREGVSWETHHELLGA